MIDKIKMLMSQLVDDDQEALKAKWGWEPLSPEAMKIDIIISKLPEEDVKKIFTNSPDKNKWQDYSENKMQELDQS